MHLKNRIWQRFRDTDSSRSDKTTAVFIAWEASLGSTIIIVFILWSYYPGYLALPDWISAIDFPANLWEDSNGVPWKHGGRRVLTGRQRLFLEGLTDEVSMFVSMLVWVRNPQWVCTVGMKFESLKIRLMCSRRFGVYLRHFPPRVIISVLSVLSLDWIFHCVGPFPVQLQVGEDDKAECECVWESEKSLCVWDWVCVEWVSCLCFCEKEIEMSIYVCMRETERVLNVPVDVYVYVHVCVCVLSELVCCLRKNSWDINIAWK